MLARHSATRARRRCDVVVSLESSADEITHDARLAVDSIPGLVALLAPDGDVLFVNRRILEYTGRTLQELKQWSTGGTVHPDDLAQVIRVFTQSVASGSAYEIMQRLRRSDGIYRWFQHSGVPLRDATGAGRPLVRVADGCRRAETRRSATGGREAVARDGGIRLPAADRSRRTLHARRRERDELSLRRVPDRSTGAGISELRFAYASGDL